MDHRPRLIILGRQGAGKGTQGERLAQRLGTAHVSTGDLLRAEVTTQSDLGREVASYVRTGALVPDSLMLDLVAGQLGTDDARARGYVLDGFPRTLAQGRAFLDVLGGDALDGAVEVEVPVEVARARLAARRVCRSCGAGASAGSPTGNLPPCTNCGGEMVRREDDTDEAIDQRLALYDEKTGPLIVWLDSRDLLLTVDGTGSPDAVHDRLLSALRAVGVVDGGSRGPRGDGLVTRG